MTVSADVCADCLRSGHQSDLKKAAFKLNRPLSCFWTASWPRSRGKIAEMNVNGYVGNGPPRSSWDQGALMQGDFRMLYAILAYHVEAEVMAWTPQEDAGLMERLKKAHGELNRAGRLGPAARLGATTKARTLRGPGKGTVIDGPFAETKEQLLGLYVVECTDDDAAVEAARTLREANPHAVYEIRPVKVYLPGATIDEQRE
jgi:hypothetical protein